MISDLRNSSKIAQQGFDPYLNKQKLFNPFLFILTKYNVLIPGKNILFYSALDLYQKLLQIPLNILIAEDPYMSVLCVMFQCIANKC